MSIASTNALLEASKKLKPALKMVWVDKTRRGAVNWEGLLNRENFKWNHQNIDQLSRQTIKWMELLSTDPGYRLQSKCWDLFRQITPISRPE